MSSKGRLTILTGCMFSGKTTALLRRVAAMRQGTRAAASARIFKHAMDDRYARDAVVAHTGERGDAGVVRRARDIAEQLDAETRLVAIDEGHFFSEELSEVVSELRACGLDVLVTALDRGSWGQRFPVVDRLLEHADEHVRMFATCAHCGAPADRTQRIAPIVDGRLVGGPEAYEPRCSRCWQAPRDPIPSGDSSRPGTSSGIA